tara:strand:- start:11220 stop:11567 length:348 start_codon:yes stop_codon:yes gene_type:complete
MISGTQFEQGDIVLVPFPFTNLSGIKQRPVLILSSKEYNQKGEDIITCGITSNLSDKEHSILITEKEMLSGKLPKASRIKSDKIFTLEKSIVKRKFGKVNSSVLEKVKKEIFEII